MSFPTSTSTPLCGRVLGRERRVCRALRSQAVFQRDTQAWECASCGACFGGSVVIPDAPPAEMTTITKTIKGRQRQRRRIEASSSRRRHGRACSFASKLPDVLVAYCCDWLDTDDVLRVLHAVTLDRGLKAHSKLVHADRMPAFVAHLTRLRITNQTAADPCIAALVASVGRSLRILHLEDLGTEVMRALSIVVRRMVLRGAMPLLHTVVLEGENPNAAGSVAALLEYWSTHGKHLTSLTSNVTTPCHADKIGEIWNRHGLTHVGAVFRGTAADRPPLKKLQLLPLDDRDDPDSDNDSDDDGSSTGGWLIGNLGLKEPNLAARLETLCLSVEATQGVLLSIAQHALQLRELTLLGNQLRSDYMWSGRHVTDTFRRLAKLERCQLTTVHNWRECIRVTWTRPTSGASSNHNTTGWTMVQEPMRPRIFHLLDNTYYMDAMYTDQTTQCMSAVFDMEDVRQWASVRLVLPGVRRMMRLLRQRQDKFTTVKIAELHIDLPVDTCAFPSRHATDSDLCTLFALVPRWSIGRFCGRCRITNAPLA